MKSTKNSSGTTKSKTTKSGSSSGKKNCSKSAKSAQESDSDPDGSYTGNPAGWGRYALPVQDADDL